MDSRRGGYCFEQNTLFKAALEALGFKVTGLSGRVRWMSPPDSPPGPREHMMLAVDLPEGRYLADVGFGACVLDSPLQFKPGVEQQTAMGTYRMDEADGVFSLSAKQPGSWRAMYLFNLEPQIPSDYQLGNWYTSTHPSMPFSQRADHGAAERRPALQTGQSPVCDRGARKTASDYAAGAANSAAPKSCDQAKFADATFGVTCRRCRRDNSQGLCNYGRVIRQTRLDACKCPPRRGERNVKEVSAI